MCSNHTYAEDGWFHPINWIGFDQMTPFQVERHTTSFLNQLQILSLNKKIAELSFMFSTQFVIFHFIRETISFNYLYFFMYNSLSKEMNTSNCMYIRWKLYFIDIYLENISLFAPYSFGSYFLFLISFFSSYFTGQLLPQHMLFLDSSKHVLFL